MSDKCNCLQAIDVKSTIIVFSLLLVWTMAFGVLIGHVYVSDDNTAQSTDAVIRITNETSRLAEERWKREGGPSPEDKWRQEQAAKQHEEELIRKICTLPIDIEIPAPVTISRPVARSSHTQLEIDGIMGKQNIADRRQIEDIFDGKDKQIDIGIQRGVESLADHYAIESESLKAHLFGMVKLYRAADDTIGFAGIWLVISLGGLVICELVRWSFLGFFHYVANHLV